MKPIEAKTYFSLTPQILAEAFWGMGSDEQAEFFHELARVVKEDNKSNPHSYSLGEMQWLYMMEDIKKRSKDAADMYMALSAFAFDYWPQKTEL